MAPRDGGPAETPAEARQTTIGDLRARDALDRGAAAVTLEVAANEAIRHARWARDVQRPDAEDLVSTLIVAFLEERPAWLLEADQGLRLVRYLVGVLKNGWLHELRRGRKTRTAGLVTIADEPREIGEPFDDLETSGPGRAVGTRVEEGTLERECVVPELPRSVVDAMGQKRRQVYDLARAHHSRAEIAERLDWKVKSVKNELTRIRRLAREADPTVDGGPAPGDPSRE